MKDKSKLVTLFAGLMLTCALSAGALVGCNDNKHTHNYSEWGSDTEQHWKECPDDGVKDESTVADHLFIAGECECGATQQPGPVEQVEYGTVTGSVRLYKQGAYVTDALSGVTVDMGDDDVEISGSVADGKYTFEIENVQVDKIYTLTISRTGYQSYSTEIELEEEGEEVKVGGSNGVTLNYNVFGFIEGYDKEYHDFSHVNDADSYITFLDNPGRKTFNVLTTDKYGDVAATLNIEYGNSTNGMHTQGILLKFEDGKHVIVRYHNGDQPNGNIQYCHAAWDSTPAANTLFGDDAGLNEWGEHAVHTLLDAETAAIKAGGLELTLILNDGTLYTFFDNKYVAEYALPDGYADKKVQIGYFAWDAANNATFEYDIDETVPEVMQSVLDINVTNPADGTECTVTANPQKDVYALGEQVELTFTAPDGYMLSALTVGGKDRYGDVANGKLTITADMLELDVEATFVKEEPIALELAVKGLKLGKTTALADDTTVTFKNSDYSFTVSNGKITNDSVKKGRYTVHVDGYFEKEIMFDENLTEITLEYDTFKELLGWGSFNFDSQNATKPSFGITNDCAVILTKETYGRVLSSIYLKGDNQNAGNGGLVFRFVGNGLAANGESVTITFQGTKKVQFSKDGLWDKTTVASGLEWSNLIYFEDCYDDEAQRFADEHAQEYLEAYAAGTLKMSVLREGSTFYVYLNDRYIGQQTVDAKYANAQCEVGFLSSGLGNTSEWKTWIVDINDNAPARAAATVTNETTDTNGTVGGVPTDAVKVGDEVTLTVTPNDGYKLSKLTVGGVDVTAQVSSGTYKFIVTGDTAVSAEFTDIVYGSIESNISVNKLGTATAMANGTEVTLSNSAATYNATVADGKISLDSIAVGTYMVSAAGALNGTVTVTETKYTTDIVLEYDLFEIVRWDSAGHGLSHVNESEHYVEWIGPGASLNAVSKENMLSDATVSITLKSSQTTNPDNQEGLIFRFEDGKAAILNINTDASRPRLQFRPELFSDDNNASIGLHTAFASDWVEFNNVTQAELDKFNSDTGVVLKVVREANKLYVFLDDVYHGTAVLPEEYSDDKMGFGLFAYDAVVGAKWYFNVSETAERAAATVTNATTDTNGALGGLPTDAVKVGDEVTLTITPNDGYELSKLTVGGKEVTDQVDGNTYKFNVSGDTTVSAEFTAIEE